MYAAFQDTLLEPFEGMCATTRIVSDFVATTKIEIQGQLGGRLPNQNVSSGNENPLYWNTKDNFGTDLG